jgi:hypothetical protein
MGLGSWLQDTLYGGRNEMGRVAVLSSENAYFDLVVHISVCCP